MCPSRWSEFADAERAASYDDRWHRLEAAGEWPHGEADLVCWFKPNRVLDAGCGTGRVALELHRRGIEVVGVDLDPDMLAVAQRKSPDIPWLHADLVDVTVDNPESPRKFDVVVMAGNVMVFVAPGTESSVIANMARHLRPGGRLVAGFQLGRSALTADAYHHAAHEAGLVTEHQWCSWDRDPYDGGDYVVLVHSSSGVSPA